MAHVDLSPRFEKFVREQLESGRYASVTEVFEEALHLMEARDAEADALAAEWSADELRAKVRESLDDPRPSIPADEVFAEIRGRLSRLKSDSAA